MTSAERIEIDDAVAAELPGARFMVDPLVNPTGVVMLRRDEKRYFSPVDKTQRVVAPFPVTTLAETKPLAVAAAVELRSFLQTL